MNKYTSAQCME